MAEVETNNAAVFDLINNETHDESHQINSPEQPQENLEQEDRIVEHEQEEQAEQNEQADQGNQEEQDNLKGKAAGAAEVEEPQTAAYSNAEQNETLGNLNSSEVKTELYALHNKVDQILGRYVIPRHTYELGTLVQPGNVYSLSASHHGVQNFEFINPNAGSNYTHNLTTYNNPFSARDAIEAREEKLLRSSVKSTKSTTYASPVHQHKPSYDVEKLDKIISKIVGAPIRTSYISNNHYERESLRSAISPVRESYKEGNLNHSMTTQEIFLASGNGSHALAALGSYAKKISTQSSPVVRFSDTPVRSSYKDVVARESEQVKRSAPKAQQVPQEAYFCGAVENDVDSMVMDYMDDAAHEIESKKEQYTNHYVGNLVDDADEAPRTKRVGKRQQIINAKKGNVEQESAEFVKKGLYEQKNKEQVNASQAEKYFERDANQLEDFRF